MRNWKLISFEQYSEMCKYRDCFDPNLCYNSKTESKICSARTCPGWRQLGRKDLEVVEIKKETLCDYQKGCGARSNGRCNLTYTCSKYVSHKGKK